VGTPNELLPRLVENLDDPAMGAAQKLRLLDALGLMHERREIRRARYGLLRGAAVRLAGDHDAAVVERARSLARTLASFEPARFENKILKGIHDYVDAALAAAGGLMDSLLDGLIVMQMQPVPADLGKGGPGLSGTACGKVVRGITRDQPTFAGSRLTAHFELQLEKPLRPEDIQVSLRVHSPLPGIPGAVVAGTSEPLVRQPGVPGAPKACNCTVMFNQPLAVLPHYEIKLDPRMYDLIVDARR
jgi:hypothetical protein